MDGILYYINCFFVFANLCSTYIYCVTISELEERDFLGSCSRPSLLSFGSKQLEWYSEMVSRMILVVQRKLKAKVTTLVHKKRIILLSSIYIHKHAQTREKERERDEGDRKTDRGEELSLIHI